jgi:2-polyprenyl-3-methyl-5-hydroxy-6-metoxy-1,4-benzoquinol methylase
MKPIAISAYLDDQPRFFMQAWNWVILLVALGTQHRADIFLHVNPKISAAKLATFDALGVKLIVAQPFGTGAAAYCNKITQLSSGALDGYDCIILCDLDIAFLHCPTRLADTTSFRAKIVDAPRPPLEKLQELITAFEVPFDFDRVELELYPGEQTLWPNCNGGLYIVPGVHAATFGQLWKKWAQRCLDQSQILDDYVHHADQIGFMLGVKEMGAGFEKLSTGANFPIHFASDHLATLIERDLQSLHYHDRLDAHGYILPTGLDWIDGAIASCNQTLAHARRDGFDNAIFWDFRYDKDPELGSGVGSRGDVLRLKQHLLTPIARILHDKQVLDVGCGDLETMREMPFTNYHGVDASDGALALAAAKRPDWTFSPTKLASFPDDGFDGVFCLDVLIHQDNQADYRSLIDNLVRVSRGIIVASGFSAELPPQSGITFHHGGLLESLTAHPKIAATQILGSYRSLDLVLATTHALAAKSTSDIDISGIIQGCQLTQSWPLLLSLIEQSKSRLGFFPRTIIRTIEYPWFAENLIAMGKGRVMDLGAGVCILPLWLAQQGFDVVTVDLHTTNRNQQDPSIWNEWGFLDYGALDDRIASHNINALEFTSETLFDAVYSVSVIEHMPAVVRRAIINRLPTWLRPEGKVFLSIDLIPGTDQLWLLSEGVEVDLPHEHGTLDDLLDELRHAGLTIGDLQRVSAIANSRTDLALIVAHLSTTMPEST